MRSLLFLSAAVGLALGAGGAARAADITDPEAPVMARPGEASPVYIWSGAYAGAFVGYNATDFDSAAGIDVDGDGAVGGLYGGFNFQDGSLVYGIEGDIGGADVSASGLSPTGAPLDADTNVFGSLRGRVGVTLDPFMVFATGGLAVSEQELSLGSQSDTQLNFGPTVGAGIEGRITDSVTSRLEYRYSNFGDQTYDLGDVSVSSGFDEHSVRAGIAFEF